MMRVGRLLRAGDLLVNARGGGGSSQCTAARRFCWGGSASAASPDMEGEVDPDVERDLRAKLAAAYRISAQEGWDLWMFNHITARIPGTDHFLINGLGQHFSEAHLPPSLPRAAPCLHAPPA